LTVELNLRCRNYKRDGIQGQAFSWTSSAKAHGLTGSELLWSWCG